ncbi:SpoIID/LytB domain-containing protein [Nocardioides sp. GCM10027113]|uniref:SpoIID/LytB domain-containing protein n=1 Tax=unclassified Nocardioides TaxID=2615069 RepID=UPI0036196A18
MNEATTMRRIPTALLAALGLAVAATAGPVVLAGPAHAATDSWDVPRKARIVINGHGYGHGHGMSQYGAEGAARKGLGHREIAEFYYPGTDWGKAGGRIAVQITADTTDDLVVEAAPGLTLLDASTKEKTVLPDKGASRWRVQADPSGATQVAHYRERWRRFRTLPGEAGFVVRGGPVSLVTPSGTRAYRGRLWSRGAPGGPSARDTVNVLRLEHYLRGVVPLEIPALWSPAAVRAQAIAARTYAAYERRHRSGPICDTWSCQVYGGYSAEHPASNDAIARTRRLVLEHDGEPAFTQFGSSSGGWTSAGSVPYLVAQEDPYDGWAGNPNHRWSVTVDDTRFEQAWPAIGNLRRLVVVSRDGNGEWGGRLRTLRVVGSDGSVTVSGDTLRSALGLKSTWVTFEVRRRK